MKLPSRPQTPTFATSRRQGKAGRSQPEAAHLLQVLVLAAVWIPANSLESNHAVSVRRHGEHVAAVTQARAAASGSEPADEEGSNVYRPWSSRFRPQGYDINDASFDMPEWRLGYRRFTVANPNHAMVPNGDDRKAQSNVVFVFGLTILSTVVSLVFALEKFQLLNCDGTLEFAQYQKRMLWTIACATIPWICLQGWLLSLFFELFAHPCRENVGHHSIEVQCWQCQWMLWYFITTPIINFAYFFVQILWATHIFFGVEKQAQMGRMFNSTAQIGIPASGRGGILGSMTAKVCQPSIRHSMFLLQVINFLVGTSFVSFRWGANSHYCKPEVYWTTLALVVCNSIIVVFTALAFFCSICVHDVSTMPWIKDFSASFSGGRAAHRRAQKAAAKQKAEAVARDQAETASPEEPAPDEQMQLLHDRFHQQHQQNQQSRAAWEEAKATIEKPLAHALAEAPPAAREHPQELVKRAATTIINATGARTQQVQAKSHLPPKPAKVLGYGVPQTQSSSASEALPMATATVTGIAGNRDGIPDALQAFPTVAAAPVPSDPLLDISRVPAVGSSDNWRSAHSSQGWQSVTSQAFMGVLGTDANQMGANVGSPRNRAMWGSSMFQQPAPMAVTEPPQASPPMEGVIPRNLPWRSEGFAAPFGQVAAPSTTNASSTLQPRTFLDARPSPARLPT